MTALSAATALRVGDLAVDRAYLGGGLVWEPPLLRTPYDEVMASGTPAWGYWPMLGEESVSLSPATTADTGSDGTAWSFRSSVGIAEGLSGSGRSAFASASGLAYRDSCPAALQGTTGTATVWFEKTAAPAKGMLVCLGSSTGPGWGVALGNNQGDQLGHNLVLVNNGVAWHATGVAVSTGVHHVMAIRTAPTTIEVYLDGVLVHTQNTAAIGTPTVMGIGQTGGASGIHPLSTDVRMGETAFFGPSLAGARAAAHYNGGAGSAQAVSDDAPVVRLTFASHNPTGFKNDLTSRRTLEAISQVPTPTEGPHPSEFGRRWANAAGRLETFEKVTQPQVLTYEAWVWVEATPTQDTWLMGFGGNGQYGTTAALVLLATGRLNFQLYSGSAASIAAPGALALGMWHHVVCSVGPQGARIRVNKSNVATSGVLTVSSFTTGAFAVRGTPTGSATPSPGTGAVRVAKPAVWTSQLSVAETDGHYDAMYEGGELPVLSNDNFANAFDVEIATNGGTYNSPLVDNAAFTKEPGEIAPTANNAAADRSAWWKYQPLSSGTATFDTGATVAGSGSDSEMAVYRQDGTGIAGLVSVGSDQDSSPSGGYRARIANLAVTAGQTYYIQVGSYNGQTMQYGLAVTGPATA